MQNKVDLAQGLLHLPTLPAFPGPSGPYAIPDDSASPGQHSRDAPETGAAPNGLLCSEPTAPWSARHGGVQMSNTGATADFAVFSSEVERGLFSAVHGRGANKPVAFQPILRDDSAPHRWHGNPSPTGTDHAWGQGSPPLCYLQELDSEQPAPDWAVMLGVTKNADSPPSPDLSQAQLDTVLDSLNQESFQSRGPPGTVVPGPPPPPGRFWI